jgi:hypothetical protein
LKSPLSLTLVVALLLGAGRAPAQLMIDAAAAVAVTAEQEKAAANQARSVTRSAIGAVFGAGQDAPSGSVPKPDVVPVAVAADPIAVPPPPDHGAEALAPQQVPAVVLPPDGAPPIEADAEAAAVPSRGRDPFRPFTLDLRGETHESEILTPLQRYELPQLRLAAVVLDLSPPRAMLQDNSGMGYIVTPGTPIGRRRGVVKAIEQRRLVVEERIVDYYGREQTHQVIIEMPREDKPQNANQE